MFSCRFKMEKYNIDHCYTGRLSWKGICLEFLKVYKTLAVRMQVIDSYNWTDLEM